MRFPGPSLPKKRVPTPFGSVELPKFSPPILQLPRIGEGRDKVVKHAVGSDLAGLLAFIPYVGSYAAEQLSDLHYPEMIKNMSGTEVDRYLREAKKFPTHIIPLVATYLELDFSGGVD